MTTFSTLPGRPSAVPATGPSLLLDTWLQHAAACPDAPAFHDPDQGRVTHGRLEADSRAVAARLTAAGLRPGDRVLFSAATSYALVAAHVGALRAGLVVVPANTAYREPELRHVVTDADVAAAVIDDAERAGWVRAARPEARIYDPAELVGSAPVTEVTPLPGPDDLALIVYTSGTTGRPKGAALAHAHLASSSWAVAQEWGWSASDRLVLALPLFHVHGLGVGVHGVLLTGGSAVLLPAFSPDAVLDAVRDHDATLFFGVPTMYARILASPRVAELRALRLCVSGSAPLAADTWSAIEEATGQRVLERYGMSETVMLTSNPGDGERRPGTVGLPLPGIEARLAGVRDGVGEIQVRGGSVFGGYWRNEAATAEAFTDDGWFRTGDLGSLDDAGYLRIVGRSKELIISGGYNVYPREVEDAVATHPSVAEVAVAGESSAEWGETVVAYVVLAVGAVLDEAALGDHVAGLLASYKRPRRWVAVPALPRNALGKVVKAELGRDQSPSEPRSSGTSTA